MSGNTRAVDALVEASVPFETHSYAGTTTGDTYAEAVADELGVARERLFKTLVAEVDGSAVIAILPAARRLSLKSLARAAGGKRARMAQPATAERLTGYVTGGISPFGRRRHLPVYIDGSLRGFATVYVSGGRRGLQLEVAPNDLIRLLEAEIADLTE